MSLSFKGGHGCVLSLNAWKLGPPARRAVTSGQKADE